MQRLNKKHGYYKKPWNNSYKCMMSRCYREKDPSYKYYGGRGITVCEEWQNIENFEKWVDENPYFEGATLDRLDSNGNYEPSNCRWATMAEQDNNRRNTIYIELNGESHTISEWSEITGINRSTLNNRYLKGWDVEEIFKQPNSRQETIVIEYEGESHTISEWGTIKGLSRATIYQRYLRGLKGSRLFEPNKR